MATPRAIRTRAFQTLFELDARLGEQPDPSRDQDDDLTDTERKRAADLARSAWLDRDAADTVMEMLAPEWPARRQAAVDRAILRLAHYEMTKGDAPPKAVVNEAVELAKRYSTEKSPAFVNALLDKVLQRVLAERRVGESAAEQEGGPGDQP